MLVPLPWRMHNFGLGKFGLVPSTFGKAAAVAAGGKRARPPASGPLEFTLNLTEVSSDVFVSYMSASPSKGRPMYGVATVAVDGEVRKSIDASDCRCAHFHILKFAEVASRVGRGPHLLSLVAERDFALTGVFAVPSRLR